MRVQAAAASQVTQAAAWQSWCKWSACLACAGAGFTTVIGRVRPDPVFDVKFVVLSHNTVMGAAGSSILNAELAVAQGLIKPKRDI